MLGKLLKYDFKSLNRFMVIMHGFLLAASLIIRVTVVNNIRFDSSDITITTLTLIILACSLLFMGVSFGTYIVVAIRFYKNLYSDEGYLSHTLPVTAGQHLASKFISASVWAIIDSICITFSSYVLLSTPYIVEYLKENKTVILKELGFQNISDLYMFGGYYAFYMIVGTFFTVLMIYVSIAIGQLFSGHAILGSVVSYFAISTVSSILFTAIMALGGVLTMYGNTLYAEGRAVYSASVYMSKVFGLLGLLSLFSIPIFYLITYFLMKKKINLS